ncbi:hypothetical protein BD408DRAFT_400004 [Parasitella parasitica]|nr:hypothetical protein BD408DRAFT_400004 [Parasitella parasitica]
MVSKSTISLLVAAVLSTVSAKKVRGNFYLNWEEKFNVFDGHCFNLENNKLGANILENRIVDHDLWVYKRFDCKGQHSDTVRQDTSQTLNFRGAKSYKFHARHK